MSFWDATKRDAYLAKTAENTEDLRRLRDGEATAETLDAIWQTLDDGEQDLLRALVATGRKSFVAPHDLPLLRGLVTKDLLRYPRGHGGTWMRAARTSYSVAPAVWLALQALIPHETRGTASAEALLERVTAV